MSAGAVVAGGTGLVGGELLSALVGAGGHQPIIALVRTSGSLGGTPGVSERVVDFRLLEEASGAEGSLRDAFCCLGTTLKRAGSREAFREVDFHMVLRFAEWARAREVQRFFFVSSMGANPASPFFYSRVKGEVEAALAGVGFTSLFILRPGLLLGKRAERRLGEALAGRVTRVLRPVMVGPLRSLRPIPAGTVAAAMAHLAATPVRGGTRILESAEIHGVVAT